MLTKYAWKPITQSLKEREKFIDESLESAKKAEEELVNLQKKNEELLSVARKEREKILSDAKKVSNSIRLVGVSILTSLDNKGLKEIGFNKDVKKLVNNLFSKHPGETNDFWLGTSREEALKALDVFIKEKIQIPIQGGLNPRILLSDKSTLKRETIKYLEIFKDQPYIFNLGHGVMPQTKTNMVDYLVKLVRDYK